LPLELLAALEQADDPAALLPSAMLLRCARLTASLRVHCGNGADLLQIPFNLDVGVGD
jgi:hypothetical protein